MRYLQNSLNLLMWLAIAFLKRFNKSCHKAAGSQMQKPFLYIGSTLHDPNLKRYTKLKSKQCIFSKTINAWGLHFVLNLFQVYEDSLLRESARYGPLSNATEIALRNLDSMIATFLERMSLTSKVMRVESFTFCYPFNQNIVQSFCHESAIE